MAKPKKLTTAQYARALWGVASLSFKTAPGAFTFKLFGVVIDALLPIAVTYFAALTTTELAAAFGGSEQAGQQALIFIAITAGLGFFTTIWHSIDQYIQALVRYRLEAKVSDIMYERFLSLDFWQYDDKDTADLYDRAKQFSQFYAYVFDRIGQVISQLITVVFSLIALFIFLPLLALFILLAVVPGVYLQFKLSRMQIAHWNTNVDTRRIKTWIEWKLFQPASITGLRLNNLVQYFLKLRQKMRDKDEKQRLIQERKFIGKRLMADGLEAITELGALVWIALQIIAREQPIGQFVYVQQLVSRSFSSANGFIGTISNIDEDLANLFDYQRFMQLPTGRKDGIKLQATPQTIKFDTVTFRYPGTKRSVLKNLSFEIKKGQHVAIVGENGAGKSTLIKLLTGLYNPIKGSVTVDGTPLSGIDLDSWHRQLSVLQQDFQKYEFTDIADNIYYGNVEKPLSKTLLKQSIDKAEATKFIDKLPNKLKTLPNNWIVNEAGEKGVELSGGQWQRLALARNFYRNTPIIILDEPTSAIDALAEARIFDRLFAKSNQKTVITISHRLTTVEKADTIIVLRDGEIVQQGTHSELAKQRSGEYFRMFESQLVKNS